MCVALCAIAASCSHADKKYGRYVNKFVGTGLEGRVTPVASVPFGMVQIGADTRSYNSGYHYDDSQIWGFSHLHKSGGGCGDFLDILFLPLPPGELVVGIDRLELGHYQASFSHRDEYAAPGKYAVDLYDHQISAEQTATARCGLQRYRYQQEVEPAVLVDLQYGSTCACTIQYEHDVDTVYDSYVEMPDKYTLQGYRMSNGWATDQRVFFHTRFSMPIKECVLFVDENRQPQGTISAKGQNLRVILTFGQTAGRPLDIKTGISTVDMEGASENLQNEVGQENFTEIEVKAERQWEEVLKQIEIETEDVKKKELFYTALHNVMMYPMLFSDVDNRYRGPDRKVYQTDGFKYYGAVVGLWDTFRAACPLNALLQPEVMRDYVRTSLVHYAIAGQLPIWTLAGVETYQMIGLHAIPLITNCYLNGIDGFDTRLALEAMKQSAMKDTCGYSMGYFVGLENYKKYGYVPCDL